MTGCGFSHMMSKQAQINHNTKTKCKAVLIILVPRNHTSSATTDLCIFNALLLCCYTFPQSSSGATAARRHCRAAPRGHLKTVPLEINPSLRPAPPRPFIRIHATDACCEQALSERIKRRYLVAESEMLYTSRFIHTDVLMSPPAPPGALLL